MAETAHLRLALAQIDPTVGDLEGNARLISESIERGRDSGAQLVILPELCLSGYPPEDLVLRRDFLDAVRQTLDEVAADVEGTVALVGFPERVERPADELEHFDPLIDPPPPPAFNSLAVLAGGEVRAVYRKCDLPNYGVFDERRYFEPGNEPALIEVDGALVGLTVCEDIWHPGFPESDEVAAGAHLVVNSSASPYHRGKGRARESMIADRARSNGAAFALCNMVGGQDELVFDGASVVIGPDGKTLARAAQFEAELLVCDLTLPASGNSSDGAGSARQVPVLVELSSDDKPDGNLEPRVAEPLAGEEAEVYGALTLGLRDYVEKNGFERVVIALSGGIDSALVALIAVDALGADRVSVVVMPSPHSSDETQSDARAIAANLGVELIEISIAEAMEAYERALASSFEGAESGLAEENLQARIRGNLVMALSNKFGWLVLTTGNKSEMSVGYATLYGDMAGGFAVIKDIFKLLVYRLVRWRNEQSELVPASVLDRPPSAELRPDQLDEDSLPPYETLDRILEAYVERDEGVEALVAQGLSEEAVLEVIRLVDRAEYKRRQAPPGIRVSTKAFGRDRRLPITNRFGSMRKLPR
jgi:NAD+ synthase (glutamine-hydrolysing)